MVYLQVEFAGFCLVEVLLIGLEVGLLAYI
jgi:hypothetical protein